MAKRKPKPPAVPATLRINIVVQKADFQYAALVRADKANETLAWMDDQLSRYVGRDKTLNVGFG